MMVCESKVVAYALLVVSVGVLLVSVQGQKQGIIFFPREEAEVEIPCQTYNGQFGLCELLVKCTTFFAEIAELSRSPCAISEDQMGVCCPPSRIQSIDPSTLVAENQHEIFLPQVDIASQNIAIEMGIQISKENEQFEQSLIDRNQVAQPGSAVHTHAKLFPSDNTILQKAKTGAIIGDAAKQLSERFHLTEDEINIGLPTISLKTSMVGIECKEPTCPDFRYSYRTMDGTCNNVVHKNWGAKGQAFKRKIHPIYSDGNSAFRLASSGQALPSARFVSTSLAAPVSATYNNLTNLIWQWGQFLDHDITHTPLTKMLNDSNIACCNSNDGTFKTGTNLHKECMAIVIPENDAFYSRFNQRCMDFVRSAQAIPRDCKFANRQQMNMITAYIDGSNVYGSDEKAAGKLRANLDGKLKTTNRNGRELLPKEVGDKSSTCQMKQECSFFAGDARVNEQLNLVVMHTIWVRQHNHICGELKKLNPSWNDEILYQEARRIVVAQMQHITYNEYLPIVLGRDFIETYGLLPLKNGYFRGYDSNVDATIINSFATAAFRYGHTLITDTMKAFDKLGQQTNRNNDELSVTTFNPISLYKRDTLDDLIRGLTKQKSQKVDRFFSEQLTNKLFSMGKRFGMDLVALNVQRGRDHGLAPYSKWQETCGLSPIHRWEDLSSRMNNELIAHLRTVYDDVNDIDLFIGGVSETVAPGSLLGPTFLCIIGQQFITLKIGDRFYYENGRTGRSTIGDVGEPLSSFSETQLKEIRRTTLSRILCDRGDDILMMQPLAFLTGHLANKRAVCATTKLIPRMSLAPWQNSRIWAK